MTNESHPIISYFMNNKIHDEYATKPRTTNPIFIRAIEYLSQLQIDERRIETTPYYLRLPWRKNRYVQMDQSQRGSIRFRAEKAKLLEEKYNEHIRNCSDGSKKIEKAGCAVITSDQKFRKRLKPQNTIYSAEQEAIIKATYVTKRTGERRVIIIITDSLSTVTQKTTGRRKRENHRSLGARPYGNTRK
jgi:hypothetical protein